jgi:integrase
LYPSEVARILECKDVPPSWRRLVALAIYLGVRASELDALEWDDFDLEHGKVTVHRSVVRDAQDELKGIKSGKARPFSVEPVLLPLLRAMRAEAPERVRVVDVPRHRDLADKLRDMLKAVGVTRRELFVSDAKTRFEESAAARTPSSQLAVDGLDTGCAPGAVKSWTTADRP